MGIIILDTGDDKERPDVYGGLGDFAAYREQQKRWLAAALAHPAFATAPYRIVFCHIPLSWKQPDRRGEWCPDGDARWSPLLAGAKIHAVISGHTHEHWHDAPRPGRPWHQVVSGGPELTPTKWSPTPACLVTLEANPTSLLIRTTEAASGKTHLSLTINPS